MLNVFHAEKLAVPGVVPDITAVAIDTQHANDLGPMTSWVAGTRLLVKGGVDVDVAVAVAVKVHDHAHGATSHRQMHAMWRRARAVALAVGGAFAEREAGQRRRRDEPGAHDVEAKSRTGLDLGVAHHLAAHSLSPGFGSDRVL